MQRGAGRWSAARLLSTPSVRRTSLSSEQVKAACQNGGCKNLDWDDHVRNPNEPRRLLCIHAILLLQCNSSPIISAPYCLLVAPIMPKAVKGTPPPLSLLPLLPVTPQFPTLTTLASPPGVLIQCDPAIRAIILKLDSPSHEFIVDDLDEQTLVVKESRLGELKTRLDAVRYSRA